MIGFEELAARLGVPGTSLDAWIGGRAAVPDRIIPLLTDIIDKRGVK